MPQVAFLFPGQGAQAVGMGRQLYETLPAARRLFDEAAEVLGYDLAAVCAEGPPERLNSTVVSQPAIFVSSLAALESLKATQPEVVDSCAGAAGLSLGEYCALVFAGAMSFRDALGVVRQRGEAMQAASDACVSGRAATASWKRRTSSAPATSSCRGTGPPATRSSGWRSRAGGEPSACKSPARSTRS
jgi:[acyl-carrier-protein] S-malonyltransferase